MSNLWYLMPHELDENPVINTEYSVTDSLKYIITGNEIGIKTLSEIREYLFHFQRIERGSHHTLPDVANTDANVYRDDRYTAWLLYPLPIQINAETSSSECYQNVGILPSGGFEV
jgi:hypothetical protein